MQTQRNHKQSQQNTSAIHIRNNSNVSKVNYQHIAILSVYELEVVVI